MRAAWTRWLGIVIKELTQLRRDRLTFGMVVGIPVVQLVLFGFAINHDPRHLPTAVVLADPGPFARAYVSAMEHSRYFDVIGTVSAREGDRLLHAGDAIFVITFPPGFHRDLVRGVPATILVEADATDPSATGGAIAALSGLTPALFATELPGGLSETPPPLNVVLHRRFNPEVVTAYNIVPGLAGVILTLTMVLMTGLAMTRERERGTFEQLLATPARPVEVISGKIVPYVLIGLIQVTLILAAARWVFVVPMLGQVWALYLSVLLFIVANLTVGITFSSIARNQLQAMQMTVFFFMPSLLLSGFMFPFQGMPRWAQAIGNVLPLTHFLRLVRGIMLKGNGTAFLWPHMWPILLFTAVVLVVSLLTFRKTLD